MKDMQRDIPSTTGRQEISAHTRAEVSRLPVHLYTDDYHQHGKFMKIRKISQADLAERVRWMNNPAVYSTMHFVPPVSLEKTIEWHRKNQSCPSRCDMVFEGDDGALLAMGGLTAIDFTVRKAELYIFVNPERQRQGIGTLATRMLCKYGFDVLQLHKIYLYTNSTNTGGRKTYEKTGFRLEGVHRDEMVTDEKYQDRLYYGLLAGDFAPEECRLDFGGQNDVIVEQYRISGRDIAIVRDDLFPQVGGV